MGRIRKMDRWRRITGVKSLVDRIVKWLIVATVPPLRGRRAEDGAEEKAGHYGRDDRMGSRVRAGCGGFAPALKRGRPPGVAVVVDFGNDDRWLAGRWGAGWNRVLGGEHWDC